MKLNWKSIIGWTVAVLIAGFIIYSNMQEQKVQTQSKKNLYAVVPLTGAFSSIGKSVEQAINFWKENNPRAPFDIVMIDSETNATKAITALQQKTVFDESPLILSVTSMISYNLIPSVNDKNSFTFAIVTTEKDNYDYHKYQRVSNSANDTVQPIADYLAQNNLKKIAVVYSNEEFGRLTRNSFVSKLPKDIEILQDMPIDLKAYDVRIEVQKLIHQPTDAIVILGGPGLGYMNLFKELKTMNYTGQIVTGQPFSDPSVYKQLDASLSGIVAEALCTQTVSGCPSFSKELSAKLDEKGITPWYTVTQTLDALNLIKYTMENNLLFTQETYQKMGKWTGVAGDVVFSENGNSSYPFMVVRFKDKSFETIR